MHTAWVLWLAATAFALVGALLNAATSTFTDLPQATRDAITDTASRAGGDDAPVDGLFATAMVIGGVLACVVAAVTVWLAFRMKAGKRWARTMLGLASIFLIVDAVAILVQVFSSTAVAGSRGEGLTFAIFALQILAGLCAGTAVWRMHSPEAAPHFGDPSRDLTGGGRGRD